MEWIVICATAVSAVSTAVIGYFAYVSFKLQNAVNLKADQHRQELADLYQAIVIATILSGISGTNTGEIKKQMNNFNEHYSGNTIIFPCSDAEIMD